MPEPRSIYIEAHGKRWSGHYVIKGDILKFSSAYGGQHAWLQSADPDDLARQLLAHKVEVWRNKQRR